MQRLTAHVDLLSLTILVASSSSIPSTSAVLAFYESVADAITHIYNPKLLRIYVPGDAVVYLLAFNHDAMSLSRLCAILAKYKRAFEASMTVGKSYPRDYVNHFNGFLMDICNCVWRNRAFNKEDPNALGCLLPDTVLEALSEAATARGYSLHMLFSLSYSETLCALSIACFRELEDRAVEANTAIRIRHAGPVTQESLRLLSNDGGLKISWGDYRLEVLKWLEERGLAGIGELMYNTLKQLMLAKGSGTGTAVATA
jgi:centromere protein I